MPFWLKSPIWLSAVRALVCATSAPAPPPLPRPRPRDGAASRRRGRRSCAAGPWGPRWWRGLALAILAAALGRRAQAGFNYPA
eukprot:5821326-Lingulodinium_polyedra.AAC.1